MSAMTPLSDTTANVITYARKISRGAKRSEQVKDRGNEVIGEGNAY